MRPNREAGRRWGKEAHLEEEGKPAWEVGATLVDAGGPLGAEAGGCGSLVAIGKCANTTRTLTIETCLEIALQMQEKTLQCQ